MQKELQHLRLLREQLDAHVGEEMRRQILPEGETISDGASPAERAAWAAQVIARMDQLLDEETRIKVRESCACSVSERDKKTFGELQAQYSDLDDYLRALNASAVAGHIERRGDTLTVNFGAGRCFCSVVQAAKEPMSPTFCHCCKGHMRQLYSLVVRRPVDVEMLETITTGGQDCRFSIRFELAEGD